MSETPAFASLIRTIPDFPIPGIQFKDITPLLADGPAFAAVIDSFVQRYAGQQVDAFVGIESRGFIFGAPLAYQLKARFIPVRKPGKLPADTLGVEYALEYGTNRLEIHRDALEPGARVVLIDDLLATGGTVAGACTLLAQLGAHIIEAAFVIELAFLEGRARVPVPVHALISY